MALLIKIELYSLGMTIGEDVTLGCGMAHSSSQLLPEAVSVVGGGC